MKIFKIALMVMIVSPWLTSCEEVVDEKVIYADVKSDLIDNQFIVSVDFTKFPQLSTNAEVEIEELKQTNQKVYENFLNELQVNPNAIKFVYVSAFTGFTAELTKEELNRVKLDPRVLSVEQDRKLDLGKPQATNISNGSRVEEVVPCGVANVNGGTYTGSNLIFIIDTGIDPNHEDLNIHKRLKYSAVKGKLTDGHGHGTHVAGIAAAIGGNSLGVSGVAAGATVVPVRVFDETGQGSTSSVIDGIDYVYRVGQPYDVANLSLGGGMSIALDNAVTNLANKGVLVAMAAGNSATLVDYMSPARADGTNLFSISAADCNGNYAWFSNYGEGVDFSAPGVNVYSTYKGNSYATMSGTSMAAPHAAGVLLMTGGNPGSCGVVTNDPDASTDPKICIQ